LLHCETSKELWDEAQSLTGAHTKSKTIYLKSEFHNTRKEEMKIDHYLLKMKNLMLELIDELILLATHLKYYDGPIVI